MKSGSDSLRVKGSEIVNGKGEVVRLRGFCLADCLMTYAAKPRRWRRLTQPSSPPPALVRCSAMKGWPTPPATVNSHTLLRPAVLEVL